VKARPEPVAGLGDGAGKLHEKFRQNWWARSLPTPKAPVIVFCSCLVLSLYPGSVRAAESRLRVLGVGELLAAAPSGGGANAGATIGKPGQAVPFEPFAPRVSVRWDAEFLWVESQGLPAHPMMTGITAWQQQVPLPQAYMGLNAWRIPLHPKPAQQPRTVRNQFLRGAIAVAVNGIPIFNPQNNRGEVSADIGELDQWGGHCGRADDYHYHAAPLHLQKTLGPHSPIAYALDGYPIFGLTEPDGKSPAGLDAFNGHANGALGYHYHASLKYPFVNGGFHGEVVEKEGQVDPQPRARPVRPALQALRGARITGFETPAAGVSKVIYELNGEPRSVQTSLQADGSVAFEFFNGREGVVKQTYDPRSKPEPGPGRGPGAGPEQPEREPKGRRGEGRPGEGRPPEAGGPNAPRRAPDPEGGPRKPWLQVHGGEMDENHDGILAEAEVQAEVHRTFLGYDTNKDGRISREEISGPPVRSPLGGFAKEHFEKMDSEKAGFLTEAVFQRELRRMFEKMDVNRDGKLTPEEWRDLPAGEAPPPRPGGPPPGGPGKGGRNKPAP
jgi:hypothetical protein